MVRSVIAVQSTVGMEKRMRRTVINHVQVTKTKHAEVIGGNLSSQLAVSYNGNLNLQ